MRLLGFLILSISLALSAFGQEASPVTPPDTVAYRGLTPFDPEFSLQKPLLIIPPLFEADILFREPLFLVPRQTFGSPPPLLEKPTLEAIDIMLPWRLQMERERRLRPLQTILATVQIGGVAYLAYEHIRKHGLFR